MNLDVIFLYGAALAARAGRCRFLWGDRRAVTAVEYSMIAGIIAVAVVASIATMGGSISHIFNNVSSEL
jgi:pilus assembly protein Flp/PilA